VTIIYADPRRNVRILAGQARGRLVLI